MTSKQEADGIWKRYIFYFGEDKLKAKQFLTHIVIAEIVRVLIEMGESEEGLNYWHEVKKHIYEHD